MWKKAERILLVCMICSLFIGCAKREETKNENGSLQGYQLFYGTWEYTAIVSEHYRLGGDEGCEALLGTTVTYMPDYYECGQERIDAPTYLTMIYPMNGEYILYFPEQRASMKELLPEVEYYTYIQIVNKPVWRYNGYAGNEFVVKDENTLFAFDYNCIYELKRVGYMEDAVSVAESNPSDYKMAYEQNDAYKLFYGTWEYTGLISAERSEGENYIGKVLTYMPDYFSNGAERVDDPVYRMVILPLNGEKSEELLSQLPLDEQSVIAEVLPETDAAVYVEVCSESGEALAGVEVGCIGYRFLIVDDDTMLCFENGNVYELRRKEYIEGYGENPYAGSYQERW